MLGKRFDGFFLWQSCSSTVTIPSLAIGASRARAFHRVFL